MPEFSRLGLGTAEIGFAYGIGPRELPSEDTAITLLKEAVDLGVTFFDTASYYGLAEERIGKSGILKNPDVIVCTKCAKFLEDGEYPQAEELEKRIRTDVEASLTKLKTDCLQILMLHGPSAEQIEEGLLTNILDTFKKKGKIKSAGVSTRGEEPPMAAIKSDKYEVIQVAISIADQRMLKRVVPEAKENGVSVVNRSVFLKGAFAGRINFLPSELTPLKQTVALSQGVARKHDMDLAELALRFSLSIDSVSASLIGTSNLEHLKDAVRYSKQGPLPEDIYEELNAFAIPDVDQVDPARWPK